MNIFGEKDFYQYEKEQEQAVLFDLRTKISDGLEETEIKKMLLDKYTLDTLDISKEPMKIPMPSKGRQERKSGFANEIYMVDIDIFEIPLEIKGKRELFLVSPTTRTLLFEEVEFAREENVITFKLIIDNKDPEKFKNQLRVAIDNVRINLPNINKNIENWNTSLPEFINRWYEKLKKEFDSEQTFYKEIGAEN